jgi:NAD(P) transhydrogenase subunit beta
VTAQLTAGAYLLASLLFILSLSGLSSPVSARRGSAMGMIAMVLAIAATIIRPDVLSYTHIALAIGFGALIGLIVALKISMTDLPQLVAAFHSLVGLAAVFVASAAMLEPSSYGLGQSGSVAMASLVEMCLGAVVGAITFSSSIVAFAKLQGLVGGAPFVFPGQKILHALLAAGIILACGHFAGTESHTVFWGLVAAAFVLGLLFVLPIGGADMPVVVSLLNSFSGWAACGIGFTLDNHLLIITGALVGSSGAILSHIMCKGMNRSLVNVLVGGFGVGEEAGPKRDTERNVNHGSAEDAAFILQNVDKVIIVPGYGMAVARAQHALKEMVDALEEIGVNVKYAIHPVAGRMPGHMNVLLAEADVPYENVFELENINSEFANTDVVYVIGANDITNPCAKTDKTSAIYGMPILNVENAGRILFVKRSLGVGYAGIDNELFYRDKTMMLFGDAKQITESILKELGS